MKNNDRKILESLISKYGKSGVNLAINRLNENNEKPKSGIFIEYHDHLSCDAFRILVLDNGVNVLKNDPLEVEATYRYSGNKYIAKLEPKYGDYIEVDLVHSYGGDLCLTKVVKELHAKYSNLPIYCFTEGFYTFKGEYKNVQDVFNKIFSERLKNLSFKFIPGTMGEFLKNNNMNESLNENFGQTINGIQNTTIEDYERYWNVNIEVVYFNKDNNRCAIYMWLPEDEIINEIPEALLKDGIVFERNGMNYWFEPNPSDCYLTHNGTCISLGGYAYPEY